MTNPLYLHLGAGGTHFVGWVNIDINDLPGIVDRVHDLTKGIPYPDASCQLIYSEHFLEHLNVIDAVALLVECRRVLVPGGVMRISVPDARVEIESSLSGEWRFTPLGKELLAKFLPHAPLEPTGMTYLNVCFHGWGHQYMYDVPEMDMRLRMAGWREGEWAFYEKGISCHPLLRNIDTRPDSLIVEAVKGGKLAVNPIDKSSILCYDDSSEGKEDETRSQHDSQVRKRSGEALARDLRRRVRESRLRVP
jgi:predicted SAM-dependent methyltransferase